MAADPDLPDELEIKSVFVAQSLLQQDDYLMVFHYNVSYPVPPAIQVSSLFHFRLMGTDGTTVLGASNPYAYNSGGYYEGAGSIYFNASNAPDWDAPVVLQIRGNPEYWTDPPVIAYTLAASDYSNESTPQGNRDVMGGYVISIAESIELDWNVIMLTETEIGTVLSSTGETYFRSVIPGLQVLLPDILAVTTADPDYTPSDYGTDQADKYAARWNGTWMEDVMDGIRDFGFSPTLVMGAATLLLIGLMFTISHTLWGTTDPALNAGVVIFFTSYLLGFVSPAVMAIITLFAGIYLVYIWMFRHG